MDAPGFCCRPSKRLSICCEALDGSSHDWRKHDGCCFRRFGFETVGVFQATGHNTSTPIGAIATSGTQDITGSHSYSLSGLRLQTRTSYRFSASKPQMTLLPELPLAPDGHQASATSTREQVRAAEYITGVTSTTVLWNNVAASDIAYSLAALAVEIKAAATARKAPPPFRKPTRFFTRRF
jgi:hypothetical protein